jgi:hypothetical protein
VNRPYKIIKGPLGEAYHLAAIEIAILLWERAELDIEKMPAIYVTTQRGGYARSDIFIQIPTWVLERLRRGHPVEVEGNYLTYYIAHELAHIMDYMFSFNRGHGQSFMTEFKRICPPECQGMNTDTNPALRKHTGLEGIGVDGYGNQVQ